MKKDNKTPGNTPFYSKYKKDSTTSSDKSFDKPFEKKSPRGRSERSFDKPFDQKRSGDKPAFKKPFDKPFDKKGEFKPRGERSFDKPFEKRGPGSDKPYDREKRNFDKPFEKRGDRPERGERPAFKKPFENRGDFKPRGERSFDKPFEKRGPGSDKPYDREKRNFDKPFEKRGDRPERGERPAFKKPFENKGDFKPRGERNFDKPFERRDDRNERPYDREKRNFDKPFERRDDRSERPYDREKRNFDKPFERRDDRSERPYDREKRNFDKPFERRDDRNERPAFKKPFEKPFERTPRDNGGTFDGEKRPFDKPNKRPRTNEKSDENERRDRARDAEQRRVGEFKEAPRYDFSQAEQRYAKKIQPKNDDGQIRLNKYIANAGLCSRREADGLIESGQITINGKVITEMGHQVNPGEVVKYGNRVLNPEKMVYILVNKPKDYITTTDDPEGRHTVMELIAGACKERVYPVGRLDRNTTGLLLLTNDGELAEKLMHPSNEIQKIYQVELDKPITQEDFDKIKAGFDLEDGPIKPDDLAIVTPDAMVVGIEIHSGRNRIVRRIFESLGYEVLKLDRTVYGGLTKKELPRGKWRFLNEREVVKLRYKL
jgi:23S rRNA pseudouridine2605 synthase